MKNWKHVVAFLSDTALPQDTQHIRDRVGLKVQDVPKVRIIVLLFMYLVCFQPQSLEWSIVQDEFFPVKLELFQRVVRDCMYFPRLFTLGYFVSLTSLFCLDVLSFERSLANSVDNNFFTFGQLCRFIHRLAARCAQPSTFPVCTDWFGLLDFDVDKMVMLSSSDFLKRLKLRTDLTAACRIKAERDLAQKAGTPAVNLHIEKLRGEFSVGACTFIVRMLRSVRQHVSLTSDIVQGMSSFDPHVLFTQTLDQVSRSFNELYNSFRLRYWVPDDQLSLYRDEYQAFVDHLRVIFPDYKKTPTAVLNVVELLSPLPALRERPHLLHLFELSCLCLTETGTALPAVKFGDVDTTDYRSNLVDLIHPVQSYLSRMPLSVASCTSDDAIVEFKELLEGMDSNDFKPPYDPWNRFDLFGRQKIYKTLDAAYKSLGECPGNSATSVVSSTNPSKTLLSVASKTRRVCFDGGKIPKKRANLCDDASKCGSAPSHVGTSKLPTPNQSPRSSARPSSASEDGGESSGNL